MQISRIKQYVQKLYTLGPKKSVVVIQNRIAKKIFASYWRHRVRKGVAGHTWDAVVRRFAITVSARDIVRNALDDKKRLHALYTPECTTSDLIIKADAYAAKKFALLGSHEECYDELPWFCDVRLKQHDPQADSYFCATEFYDDIPITVGRSLDRFSKDIKVPWELARFQHLLVLGAAYATTHNNSYVQAITQQIDDWIRRNSFMAGIHWVCPMEVGLRAISWVLAASYVVDDATIADDWWERFCASLYDHYYYLENNWEIYDGRTSNHYLSDLVGYLYLAYFFRHHSTSKATYSWCFNEILAECNKQVFPEGTSYEGSTAYHKLVAELFMHAYYLADLLALDIPDWFIARLVGMVEFLDWCTYADGKMVTIGDNDSGAVTASGITQQMCSRFGVCPAQGQRYFKEFGLSCIKRNGVHVTVRHHAYRPLQPSGHFHNDVGSITLAVRGIAVFVDPGSFVYTASAAIRNQFRSVGVHNTLHLQGHEPVPLDDQLFKLSLPTRICADYVHNGVASPIIVKNSLYAPQGIEHVRTVILSDNAQRIIIKDRIITIHQAGVPSKSMVLNFTLAPGIEPVVTDTGITLLHQGTPLAQLRFEHLRFSINNVLVSYAYGCASASKSLRCAFDFDAFDGCCSDDVVFGVVVEPVIIDTSHHTPSVDADGF